jgi:hypothetical protein
MSTIDFMSLIKFIRAAGVIEYTILKMAFVVGVTLYVGDSNIDH